MVGLRYIRAKLGRLRWGGLDTVEGLVRAVDVFDKSISGSKADFMFQNARCKERMRKLCIPGRNMPFQACYNGNQASGSGSQ
jgi:hypothetical protein